MSGKITVVGSYNVDITAFCKRFPQNGETVKGDSLRFGSGGKGFNQAVAASKAGAEVLTVAAVGDDSLSQRLFDHLSREKMTSRGIITKQGLSTGSALIEVSSEGGENRIIVIDGANSALGGEDVEGFEEDIASSDIVLCQLEVNINATVRALELAKKHGVITVLNPAPFCPLDEGVLELCDWFTPNETEAEFFSGVRINGLDDAKKAAEALYGKGIKNVLITLGKNGALYYNGKELIHCSAVDAVPVDTTGAGDSFNGGLCVALSEGMDVRKALNFASCVSGIAITRPGAADAMPERDEIEKLYADSFGGEYNESI